MAKGSSGFDKKGANKNFSPISLAGKTGTEKQKAYAQNLLETARLTAQAYGTSGYSEPDERGMRTYTDKATADSFRGAYKLLALSVENRSTYGQVIDLIKSRGGIIEIAKELKHLAKISNKSVDDMINDAKKRMQKGK